MAGLDTQRLVLVHSVIVDADGQEKCTLGTGYFVTGDLVLTASHVVSAGIPTRVEVRVEDSAEWRCAEPEPVWVNGDIDAALIRVNKPLDGLKLPCWGETLSKTDDLEWNSTAYPAAATERKADGTEWSTAGLKGTWYAKGGRGQGLRKLELGVEDPPSYAEKWKGISGAPVFVDNELIGIIKTVSGDFDGKRLSGVPVEQLLQDPGFQAAIAPTLLEPLPQGTWFLVLASENGSSKTILDIKVAINNHRGRIVEATGNPEIEVKPLQVQVTEALKSSGHWFQFVQAICKAPVMIVEVTHGELEPAVMLFLGIRSVVRRGVTVTVTTEEIKESHLSRLPFNIQETKLISLAPPSGSGRRTAKKPEPIDQIGDAITEGLTQLQSNPGYLDLPAYEAVRCPMPENKSKSDETLTALNTILMLCSFHEKYDENWNYVFGEVQREAGLKVDTSMKKPVSMVDISSPQLVGQALYERIRWSPACVVDWTDWRPNVFFELGVRLACSDTGPICVIDEEEIKQSKIKVNAGIAHDIEGADASLTSDTDGTKPDSLRGQKQKLFDLFKPNAYKLNDKDTRPFEKAFERFNSIIEGNEVTPSPLAHDATYRTIVKWYDWKEERVDMLPHEELQVSIEAQLGKDPQRTASESDILFSPNSQFANQLRNNVQERWIAAWYYFRSRYLPREFSQVDLAKWKTLPEDRQEEISDQLKKLIEILDPQHRAELTSLIENVGQVLSKSQNDDHERIREEIEVLQDVNDELELKQAESAEIMEQTDE